jgi:hypothetical protein
MIVIIVTRRTPSRGREAREEARAEGYTHAEIAAVLADGTTARAVAATLHRYRRQVVRDREANRDDR